MPKFLSSERIILQGEETFKRYNLHVKISHKIKIKSKFGGKQTRWKELWGGNIVLRGWTLLSSSPELKWFFQQVFQALLFYKDSSKQMHFLHHEFPWKENPWPTYTIIGRRGKVWTPTPHLTWIEALQRFTENSFTVLEQQLRKNSCLTSCVYIGWCSGTLVFQNQAETPRVYPPFSFLVCNSSLHNPFFFEAVLSEQFQYSFLLHLVCCKASD